MAKGTEYQEAHQEEYKEEDGEYNVFEVDEPYQQFERVSYEALAVRKRKALSDHRENNCSAKKPRRANANSTNIDEIMEGVNYNIQPRSKKYKKRGRGRPKGSKMNLTREVSRKLGEANLLYATCQHERAITVPKLVIMLAPNLSETYYTLGLIYEAMREEKKATNFYMLAARLGPKDHPYIWEKLVDLYIQLGNVRQAVSCISKAIKADPENISLRFRRVELCIELGEYQKAAESYHGIGRLQDENVEAWKMAAKLYYRCNQVEKSTSILEEYINDHSGKVYTSLVDLLVTLQMTSGAYAKALEQIANARSVYYSEKRLPLYLTVMEGICQLHVGKLEDAGILLSDLRMELSEDVADELALKYYFMIEEIGNGEHKASLHLKIVHCYLFLMDRTEAIKFYRKALLVVENNIDTRLTLASLLTEEGKEGEAITLLSPPTLEATRNMYSLQSKPWWLREEVKMQLARVYYSNGMVEEFVNAIFPSVHETLYVESLNQKVGRKKCLSRSVLKERTKLLDDHKVDSVFCGIRPKAAPSELLKAARAKKILEKKAALKEETNASVLAAGMDWCTDDSDDEFPLAQKEPPLPKLLKENKHYQLILDLSKALVLLQRYPDAMQIITDTLRLTYTTISLEKKEGLRLLGSQIADSTNYPSYAYDYVRYNVLKHPYSFSAWNCYYKVVLKLENQVPKHAKFLLRMRRSHKDCTAQDCFWQSAYNDQPASGGCKEVS